MEHVGCESFSSWISAVMLMWSYDAYVLSLSQRWRQLTEAVQMYNVRTWNSSFDMTGGQDASINHDIQGPPCSCRRISCPCSANLGWFVTAYSLHWLAYIFFSVHATTYECFWMLLEQGLRALAHGRNSILAAVRTELSVKMYIQMCTFHDCDSSKQPRDISGWHHALPTRQLCWSLSGLWCCGLDVRAFEKHPKIFNASLVWRRCLM